MISFWGYSFAQEHDIQWAKYSGGTQTDDVFTVTTDNLGNVFSAGGFQGTAMFGATTLTSAGGRDMHLSKQDAEGNFLWTIHGQSPGSARGISMDTDASGNVFISGYYYASFTLGAFTVNAVNSDYNIYVAKIDANGNCLWLKTIDGSIDATWSFDLEVDDSGNAYVVGEIIGDGYFDSINTTNIGNGDLFVTKINSSGTFQWARQMGGSTYGDQAYGVALDGNGNIYITGYFQGTANIAGQTLTSASSSFADVFIAKLDNDGNGIWAHSFGDNNDHDLGRDVVVDANGDVIFTGLFKGTINFEGNSITSTTEMYGSTPGYDVFLVKLDANGNGLWAESAGEARDDYVRAIDVDSDNNIYISGYTEGDMRYDADGVNYVHANTNDQSWSSYADVFVACYRSNGSFAWASGGGDGYDDKSYDIAVDANSNVYVGGTVYETGSASFEGLSPTGPSISTDVDDALVVKYKALSSGIAYAKTDVGCYGENSGSINISVDFGTAPYTFAWEGPNGFTSGSEDIENLYSGVYNITVSDGLESVEETIEIYQPDTLIAYQGSVSFSSASGCNIDDGFGHVIAEGGTQIAGSYPYVYSWPGTAEQSQTLDLYPGVYLVTVTDDNGCVAHATIEIGPESDGGYVSGSTTICENESTGDLELASNVGDIVKWQKSFNSGAWEDISNTSNIYSETLVTAGTYEYRAISVCGNNPEAASTAAVLEVEMCSSCADEANIYEFTFNNATYELVKEAKTWSEAADCAVQRGGKLVEINNQAEQDAVYNAILDASVPVNYTTVICGGGIAYVWTGATDSNTEGTWLWDGDNDNVGVNFYIGQGTAGDGDGQVENNAYVNWGTIAGSEPDNFSYAGYCDNDQDAVGIALDSWPHGNAGEWNDIQNDEMLYYIIEYTTVGINTISEQDINVYPNPVKDFVNISVLAGVDYELEVEILSVNGIKLLQQTETAYSGENNFKFDISSLDSGIYVVKIKYESGTLIKRIVK